ncbi:MAG: hypothetical protein JKX79_11000 [Labilibaculum sp.]|nr:hypothetical protein [Labilibaculum sp.]
MDIYRYFYYKLYCIWLKKKDEPENAPINAHIHQEEWNTNFPITLPIQKI